MILLVIRVTNTLYMVADNVDDLIISVEQASNAF